MVFPYLGEALSLIGQTPRCLDSFSADWAHSLCFIVQVFDNTAVRLSPFTDRTRECALTGLMRFHRIAVRSPTDCDPVKLQTFPKDQIWLKITLRLNLPDTAKLALRLNIAHFGPYGCVKPPTDHVPSSRTWHVALSFAWIESCRVHTFSVAPKRVSENG